MGDTSGQITDRAISYGRRLGDLARERPADAGLVFVERAGGEQTLTWSELEARSNRVARLLEERGVSQGAWLVVGLPNSPEHIVSTLAGWKLGACVLPVSARLPAAERDGLLDLAAPTLVVSVWDDLDWPNLARTGLESADALSDETLPDRIPHPGKAVGSGGSTGRSKIIIDPRPWAAEPGDTFKGLGGGVGMAPGRDVLIPGPLYHNAPYCWTHWSLFEGLKVVVMEKFDAELALDLIERHRVGWAQLVPTTMQRMLRVPDVERRDLSSLQAIMHTAAPCPPWVKRGWIELIGAEKILEAFGATEAIGATIIRGDEWLEREGSVGRPAGCVLRILDDEGRELPCGEVGEIYMRLESGEAPAYEYRGAPPAPATADGFVTVGDMGWLDEDGYLFLADRRTDLIITGGANVYPHEVEAVIGEHPGVADVAVIGLQDREWGKRVHAVLSATDPADPPSAAELDLFCRDRLVSYKVPKSYEVLIDFPRDEAGKIRRSALAAERRETT
ncbi:MAG: AMP-binding protein [Gemmatimonadota bacterium]|nr:AMP-binding protein [Gemmatimonadota bacterium]